MTGKFLVLTPLLFMLTSCQQEQLSLPVTHAASTEEVRSEIQRSPVETGRQDPPSKNCYAYILLRPRDQRAEAVQARLKKADLLSAAFDSQRSRWTCSATTPIFCRFNFPLCGHTSRLT